MIRRDLSQGGFSSDPRIETVTARSRAASARVPAMAFCQGTPLRNEIEARGDLEAATDHAASALASRHGSGEISAKIQAHVIQARA